MSRKTLRVTASTQREALTSPIRLELLEALHALGTGSVRDVAERMDRPPDALYYHLRLLERVGIIKRTGSRPAGKRSEALYSPAVGKIELDAENPTDAVLKSTRKTMGAMLRLTEREVMAAIETQAETDGRYRELFCGRLKGRLSKTALAEVNKHINAIQRILTQEDRLPARGRTMFSLTIALTPSPRRTR